MSIIYAKKSLHDHLTVLLDTALFNARRIGKVNAKMPESAVFSRAHLSNSAALFLHAKDSFYDGDEPTGAVFNSVAVLEIVRAAIAASESIEAGGTTPAAFPADFIGLCEDYGVSPATLPGDDGYDSDKLRARLFDEYFLSIETLFHRDGRPGATLLQASSGVAFERAFDRGIVAYSDGKTIPLFGIAAEVIDEIIDEVEDCAAL